MLTLALLTTAPGFSRPATSSFCAPGAGWTSEFADEFDGSALDDKVWTVKEGGGNAYCRSATCSAEDVYVEDGALILRTRRDANNASAYTSGGVDTRRKVSWRHSPAFRICISAMLPGGGGKGQGVWPAHWLMPDSDACDPDQGEMDIMEMIDGDGVHHSTYHWQTTYPSKNCTYPKGHEEATASLKLPEDWATAYHEYAVERGPTHVAFAVDGQVILNRSSTDGAAPRPLLWDEPWYLILNSALGGPWPGEPSSETQMPTYHKIDYVRASRQAVAPQAAEAPRTAAKRPHLVMAVVDDLGHAGLGYTSPTGEPRTPVIDALAAQSAVLDAHYTFRFCSPSRSSFLSGRLPLHVNMINHPPNEPGGGVPVGMTTIADKLRDVGYDTVHAGKWHGGMSHAAQLPIHRGFNSSLAMLSGAADHFTNTREGFVDMWLDDAPAHGLNGTYSLYRYTEHALAAIHAHADAAASAPERRLFLYMAFQDVHGPCEAPERFFAPYNASTFSPRLKGLAQVSAVDEALGNITGALRSRGLWDELLFVFSSDNGGPADHEANYPLRGSKGNDFEGGVRVAAFVGGGWLPAAMRGAHVGGMMHLCDWHVTFAALAGVASPAADARAAALGLPAVDALDMWPMVSGAKPTSPRVELPLSANGNATSFSGTGLIVTCPASTACPGSHGRFKLIRGKMANGAWPGVTTPNGSKPTTVNVDCGEGCLFDLDTDPTEHVDLATQKPTLLHNLRKLAAAYDKGVYQSPGSSKADPAAKAAATSRYGGFWGPWQDDAAFAGLAELRDTEAPWSEATCVDCH